MISFISKKEILGIVRERLNGGLWELDEPLIDIFGKGNELYIEVEIPGVELKDIHVVWAGDKIVIYGIKKSVISEKGVEYMRAERVFGEFKRVVLLPVAVDRNKIRSIYKNGVLTVICEKRG
jgi:HSP20 family protein